MRLLRVGSSHALLLLLLLSHKINNSIAKKEHTHTHTHTHKHPLLCVYGDYEAFYMNKVKKEALYFN